MDPSPQQMLETHEFAAKALEEVSKRAMEDGHDPGILHTAYMVTATGWLVNAFGAERAGAFLRQLAEQVETAGETPPTDGTALARRALAHIDSRRRPL